MEKCITSRPSIRFCKNCNRKINIILKDNSYWINTIKKIFCSRNCKDKWHHKNNFKVIKSIKKARNKWDINNKEYRHNYYKSRYILHPKILLTKEEKKQRKRMWNRNYKYRLRKLNTKITLDLIQMVYEDNIKQYGTLTCIYCFNSIPFGQDTLEHKLPLSRGGTNEYNNLAIACRYCNIKKNRKTVKEFMETKNENT